MLAFTAARSLFTLRESQCTEGIPLEHGCGLKRSGCINLFLKISTSLRIACKQNLSSRWCSAGVLALGRDDSEGRGLPEMNKGRPKKE